MRTFALRLVGDRAEAEAEAEELVQETFLALPLVIRSFRGDSSLRTFVLGIATSPSPPPARSTGAGAGAVAVAVAEDGLYRAADTAHFVAHDPAAALVAWDVLDATE